MVQNSPSKASKLLKSAKSPKSPKCPKSLTTSNPTASRNVWTPITMAPHPFIKLPNHSIKPVMASHKPVQLMGHQNPPKTTTSPSTTSVKTPEIPNHLQKLQPSFLPLNCQVPHPASMFLPKVNHNCQSLVVFMCLEREQRRCCCHWQVYWMTIMPSSTSMPSVRNSWNVYVVWNRFRLSTLNLIGRSSS